MSNREWHEDQNAGARDEQEEDAATRALFVTLITFVASSRATRDAKNDALDAIQRLQARLLP